MARRQGFSRMQLVGVAIFWSCIVGVIFVFIGWGILNQFRANSFRQADAVIDSIRITSSHSGRHGGTTHGVAVSYHYSVGGSTYTSTRLRYAAGSSSDSWARDMTRRFRKGAHVSAFYNPNDPGEAVLVRGVEGSDLFLMLFLTPFVMVGGSLWIAVFRAFRKPRGFEGLRVIERADCTRVRLSESVALMTPCIALAAAAFFSAFVVCFFFGGFHPSLLVATVAWIVDLVVAIAAFVFVQARIISGRRDLVLDDARKILRTPKGLEIPYGSITSVSVVATIMSSAKSPAIRMSTLDRGQMPTFHVFLHHDGQKTHLETWTGLTPISDVQRFATWLGVRLNVPAEIDPDAAAGAATGGVTS